MCGYSEKYKIITGLIWANLEKTEGKSWKQIFKVGIASRGKLFNIIICKYLDFDVGGIFDQKWIRAFHRRVP